MRKLDELELLSFLKNFRIALEGDEDAAGVLGRMAGYAQPSWFASYLDRVAASLGDGAEMNEAFFSGPHPFPSGMERYFRAIPPGKASLGQVLQLMERTYEVMPAGLGSATERFVLLFFTGVGLAVMALLVYLVIPVFQSMFAGFGQALPSLTMMVINATNFLARPEVFAIVVIGTPILVLWIRRRFTRDVENYRFFSMMGLHLDRGVDPAGALLQSGWMLDSTSLRRRVGRIGEGIAEGRSLAEAFAGERGWPRYISDALAAGEREGDLLSAVEEIRTILAGGRQLTPGRFGLIIMIGMAIVIGLLVIAMYLPIFSMATAVG